MKNLVINLYKAISTELLSVHYSIIQIAYITYLRVIEVYSRIESNLILRDTLSHFN